MEPMIFKSPERKHFLIETLKYCSFADIYRSFYKSYKDESYSTGVFIVSAIWTLVVSALLFWVASSGPMTILTWLFLGVNFALGRRNRDLETQTAGAEFALKVITAALADIKADAERKEADDKTQEK
jgi:hypothetical protein